MQNLIARASLFLTLAIFFFMVCAPLDAHAQSRSRGDSRYSSKIKKLDEDEVKDLVVPILFGVTLKNIWPNFGDPRGGGTRSHEGLDIMAPDGAPIISPTEAVVTRTGNGESSGKYVTTANPGGETFTYMHLSEISVKAGEELEKGDLIGLVGNTGNASGGAAHLHLEIRENRKATDPFPRITLELPLKDKINYLEDILEDEEDLVDFVVANYKSELWQAKVAGIKLPFDVEKKLPLVGVTTAPTVAPVLPVGELTIGSNGPLVSLIQNFLILKNSGPKARALKAAGATGYFGPVTKNAVQEYQEENNIKPADGYFGTKTLTHLLTSK